MADALTFVVNEITEGQTGSDGEDRASEVRVFQVLANRPCNASQVMSAQGIPRRGESHPDDPTLICRLRTPSARGDNRINWEVAIEYGLTTGGSGSNPDQDPLREPPDIQFIEAGTIQKPLTKAYNTGQQMTNGDKFSDPDDADIVDDRDEPTNAVVNTAGDPFSEAITIEEAIDGIIITRNESRSRFDPNELKKYKNTINKDEITIASIQIPPRCGKLKSITARVKRWRPPSGGSLRAHWEVVYTIHIDLRGFVVKPLSRGYNEKFYEGMSIGGKRRIKDTQNKDVTDPWPLDATGGAQTMEMIEQRNFYYMKYRGYWEEDWSSLALPDNHHDAERSWATPV